MSREQQIEAFLVQHGYAGADAQPLAQDASFRRYLRLCGGPRPAVLMDAAPPEDIGPFVRIARHLTAAGVTVPDIIAADATIGLLLEEDLGDDLLAVALDRCPDPTALQPQFDATIDALIAMQRAAPPPDLPLWDTPTMTQTALGTLLDWWWPAAFGSPAPDAARRDFAAALEAMLVPVAAGPIGFVHRDFFAGNLLWLPARQGMRRIAVIDFQGAALGHPAYDLVSLLQDARRDIPPSLVERAVSRYLAARPELDPAAFRAAYAACAAQRHLRVACQWVRLALRDGRPGYLVHGPRTWRRLAAAMRDPAAAPLTVALDRWIPEDRRGNPPGLAA